MKLGNLLAGAAASASLIAMAFSAHAGTPGLSFTGNTGESLSNGPFTLGWEFQDNSTVDVTSLGVFDDSLDGLAESHEVGIWNSSGVLLASATVAAGTTDPLIANFRYTSIAPITLTPGDYFIGAVWLDGADNNVFSGVGGAVTTDPAITYLNASYAAGGTLSDPTNLSTSPGYFGPNLTLTSVPEPATWAMLVLGIGVIGGGLRVARRNTATSLAAV
jgi:hypothetical protein